MWVDMAATNMAVGSCIMQGDGNLVLYGPDNIPIWASNTPNHSGSKLITQDDANVVIYDPNNKAIWVTNTSITIGHITHHYDNARTGWNTNETILNTSNVNTNNFRQLFYQTVEGDVYAQPLYLRNINIDGKGIHNVIFIATENNWVYAFDADSSFPSNLNPLWSRNLSFEDESPVPNGDIPGGQCKDVSPYIGITSTPVIDISNNIMYVVAKSKDSTGNYFHRIHALDVTSGNERHGPIEIIGNDQVINFNPLLEFNRSGLLLNKGILYIAFACHCDTKPYYGWVMAYDVRDPDSLSFLSQIALRNMNPTANEDESGAGIWMSGYGISCDLNDDIYVSTGNGLFNANTGGSSYGDSVVKLRLDIANRRLDVIDYFAPTNQDWLQKNDLDLGSGGVMVIPDQDNRSLCICGGKDAVIYLLNRNAMGNPIQLLKGVVGRNPNILDKFQIAVFGGPAYYKGSDMNGQIKEIIYYCGNQDYLKAFVIQKGLLSMYSQSTDTIVGHGGSTPSVSSNKDVNSTAIVWVITRGPGKIYLRAYDALNLKNKLGEWDAGIWNKWRGNLFNSPTIINGKVYIASQNLLTVFGIPSWSGWESLVVQ